MKKLQYNYRLNKNVNLHESQKLWFVLIAGKVHQLRIINLRLLLIILIVLTTTHVFRDGLRCDTVLNDVTPDESLSVVVIFLHLFKNDKFL